MPSLRAEHVRPPDVYEPERADTRRRLAEGKRERRVALGELLTLVFENHRTVRGVLEEALRSERIGEPEQMASEAETFAGLVPEAGELCAMTVFEVADQAELSRRLAVMHGVTESIRLQIGDTVVEPSNEHGPEVAAAGVGYLRFRLDERQQRDITDSAIEVSAWVDHPAYRARTVLTAAQRAVLAEDLTD